MSINMFWYVYIMLMWAWFTGQMSIIYQWRLEVRMAMLIVFVILAGLFATYAG